MGSEKVQLASINNFYKEVCYTEKRNDSWRDVFVLQWEIMQNICVRERSRNKKLVMQNKENS